ncbi:MAG: ABC transporter ATP-binding protein [Caldilineaceae bacterium]|nr:ABC transporter ATP-binding protein [Caldilineaceae bacterium]
MASENGNASPSPSPSPSSLLEINNLKKYFPIRRGFFKRTVGYVKAVDDVSLQVNEGETLGLVGESGCGKTTTGRMILRAIPSTEGDVFFRDPDLGRVNVTELDNQQLNQVRRNMRMIFQDPHASLNPRMTILELIGAPLRAMGLAKGTELEDRVADTLGLVGLAPEVMRRYPHAFSGGQRQRIGIARALVCQPNLVVADEPVSALDVSVQAQILNLLQELQDQMGLTYVFVAHDLSVVAHICDRVAVMYVGKIVEMASTLELYTNPKHPYTEALLSAIPKPDPRRRGSARILLEGEVANPADPPSGCYFHPRCAYAQDLCNQQEPAWEEFAPGHFAKCHFANELELAGVVA